MLRCTDCGKSFKEDAFYNECPDCGGLIETIIKNIKNAKPDERYNTIMKYHEFLPIDDVESLAKYESSKPTPIIEGKNIAKKFGFKRFLMKDETLHDTYTWKDRECLLTMNRLIIHNIGGMILSSAGNTGIAVSYYASKVKGPKVHLFLPKCSKPRTEMLLNKFSSKDIVNIIHVDGSNDEAALHAEKLSKETGFPIITGFKNYSRREGTKTFALEYIFENKIKADWYIQGVGGAIGIYGFYKAHKDLNISCPHIAGAQAEACSPFVDAMRDDADKLTDEYIPPQPVIVPEAPVLKSRKPIFAYPYIKRIINDTNGHFEKVSAEQIIDAFHTFYTEDYFVEKYKTTGTRVGLEASTALASIIKMKENGIVKDNETVLLNVSGAARPTDIRDEWWDENLIK
jgi:threonine synthase